MFRGPEGGYTPPEALKKTETEETKREVEAAEKRFAMLIDLVNKRYENPDSTLAETPEQLESFKEHNKQILEFCVQRGNGKNLSETQLKTLETAAILHDLAKGDKPPKEAGDIKNYILAAHGEIAAGELKNIIKEHPEILIEILGNNYNKKEGKQAIITIKNAIKSHMGPHPGFMTMILENVNKTLKEKGLDEIEHPYPPEGDAVSETLLAADMGSLASRKGREKVLAIRSAVPFFKKQDENLCKEYQELGIDLAQGEAALLSGFDSAKQAKDMLRDEGDKKWANELIEESKKEDYLYEGEKINYDEAIVKRERFEKAKTSKIAA